MSKEETKTKEKTPPEIKSGNMSGAEAIMQSLLAEDVDTIFGYPGGAIMPIYDEMMNYDDSLNHILVRHEQGGAHAAQAYSQVTGKPAVCMATSGPGSTNLVTGIANAKLDSIPVVFITAQVPSSLIGTDAFQETDILGISMPIVKWNYQVKKAEEIPTAIAKAFYIATSGRPGPVLLDITKDAQLQQLDFNYKKCTGIRSYNPKVVVENSALESAAVLINNSEKPLILAGHGILMSGAEKELMDFAEKTGTPVAVTLLGKSCFPEDHDLYTGMLGMHGNYGPNVNTNSADLIIAIGMRFDDRVTGRLEAYARQASIIHIELDRAEINKNVDVDVEINGDAREVLATITPMIERNSHKSWLQEFKNHMKAEFDAVIKKDCYSTEGRIHMGEIVNMVSEKTRGDAIIVTDVGQQQMAVARYYKFLQPHSLITSGGMGTMGFGMPAAVGAQVGRPDKQVISFSGDGGYQMTIQELGTIMQYKLPVKMIILNNNFLGMVRQWQDMFMDKRYASTEMVTPDFLKIAEAYGIKGELVEEREQLEASIDNLLASKDAYVLEIMVHKEANILPMIEPGQSVSEMTLSENK